MREGCREWVPRGRETLSLLGSMRTMKSLQREGEGAGPLFGCGARGSESRSLVLSAILIVDPWRKACMRLFFLRSILWLNSRGGDRFPFFGHLH